MNLKSHLLFSPPFVHFSPGRLRREFDEGFDSLQCAGAFKRCRAYTCLRRHTIHTNLRCSPACELAAEALAHKWQEATVVKKFKINGREIMKDGRSQVFSFWK